MQIVGKLPKKKIQCDKKVHRKCHGVANCWSKNHKNGKSRKKKFKWRKSDRKKFRT